MLVKSYLTIKADYLCRNPLNCEAFTQLIQQIFDFLDAGDIETGYCIHKSLLSSVFFCLFLLLLF